MRCAGPSASRDVRSARGGPRTSCSPAASAGPPSAWPTWRSSSTTATASFPLTTQSWRSGAGSSAPGRTSTSSIASGCASRTWSTSSTAAHLADNAFLFIGQGMVDQALALRPEERRPLFEEVAGVRRHERRRRRAEDQLAESAANLARVDDILAELRPQVRRLAAQAEQQASRARAGDDLAAALAIDFAARWHAAAGTASRAEVVLRGARGAGGRALEALQAGGARGRDRRPGAGRPCTRRRPRGGRRTRRLVRPSPRSISNERPRWRRKPRSRATGTAWQPSAPPRTRSWPANGGRLPSRCRRSTRRWRAKSRAWSEPSRRRARRPPFSGRRRHGARRRRRPCGAQARPGPRSSTSCGDARRPRHALSRRLALARPRPGSLRPRPPAPTTRPSHGRADREARRTTPGLGARPRG